MQRAKVLLADDSPATRMILRRLLKSCEYCEFDVVEATNGNDALAALWAPDGPRLALLDWQMPGLSGVEVCSRIRSQPDNPYVYTLLVTAREDRNSLLEGLGAGADDYLVKPFDSEELSYRLRTGLRIINLEDRLRKTQTRLEHEATHDQLTGLLNRGTVMEAFKRELDRGRRGGNQTSVILADIDFFKQVNDTHGHVAGDGVLQEVAAVLRQNLRSCDWIGRYGGEEFLMVLPETSVERAELLAERLRGAIEAHSIAVGDTPLNVTLSLGVDGTNVQEHSFVETLILNADTALYEAKRSGRNRVQRFGQPTRQGVISHADPRCALAAH